MAEDTQTPTAETAENKKKGSARALFPRLAFSKVLPLAQQVYELGEGDPVPRLVVFDRLGKSPESGPSRSLISTSSAYGLTTGGYQAERLGITDRGRSIVQASNEEAARAHVVKALLNNGLFSQFYEKYQNKGVPQQPIAVDFLKTSGGLSEADAKTAYEVFMANMNEYGFIKEMSGRPTIVSQDLMDLKVDEEEADDRADDRPTDSSKSTHQQDGAADRDAQRPKGSAAKTILPQFNFNIQVQLPENATPETYDAIFKSMAEHLLKG
jgi:hypothetical protein